MNVAYYYRAQLPWRWPRAAHRQFISWHRTAVEDSISPFNRVHICEGMIARKQKVVPTYLIVTP